MCVVNLSALRYGKSENEIPSTKLRGLKWEKLFSHVTLRYFRVFHDSFGSYTFIFEKSASISHRTCLIIDVVGTQVTCHETSSVMRVFSERIWKVVGTFFRSS